MKTKSNIAKLLEHGYHYETVSQLNDKQVKFLIERIKKEESKEAVTQLPSTPKYEIDPQKTGSNILPPSNKGYAIDTDKTTGKSIATPMESEMTEDLEVYNDPNKETETQDPKQVGPSTDDGNNNYTDGMGIFETEMTEKFKSRAQQGLFFARCKKCSNENCKWCKMAKEFADSTTKKEYKKMPKKLHPEKKVSKKTNESYELEMEKELLRILENHINPSMTKTEFVNTLMEKKESMMLKSPIKNNLFSKDSGIEMKKPIGNLYGIGKEMGENTKEKERTKKPGTKPKTRPNDNPFDDPNPGVEEKPKAHTKEKERTKKPGTKPKTRPNDNPFDDPNPDVKEKPKASDKKTKNEFLSLINKALNM